MRTALHQAVHRLPAQPEVLGRGVCADEAVIGFEPLGNCDRKRVEHGRGQGYFENMILHGYLHHAHALRADLKPYGWR